MANLKHVALLKQGAGAWNKWRFENPWIKPDLSSSELSGISLFNIDLSEADLSEAQLIRADLDRANFSNANLRSADLSQAFLPNANFNLADLNKVILNDANLIDAKFNNALLMEAEIVDANLFGANLINANLRDASLRRSNLASANLTGTNLFKADLYRADFSGAILKQANLSEAFLCQVIAIGADFSEAVLTGACVAEWNITNGTNLNGAICEHIYQKSGYRVYEYLERCPSAPGKKFKPGEFTKLFQKALSTVDLIFRNGVDWEALLISLRKLRVETEGAELSIQAIENKNDGAFVVRVNVPPEVNKAKIESLLEREYELALKSINDKYQHELRIKETEMEGYRRENTNLNAIVQLLASRTINVEASAVAGSLSMSGDRNINTEGGSYYESINTGGGDYIQGDYINMSQDLTQVVAQIQDLVEQRQKSGVTVDVAKQQVADDLATQAKSNSTLREKLTKWVQEAAGKAVVTEVVKEVLKGAAASVGIHLP